MVTFLTFGQYYKFFHALFFLLSLPTGARTCSEIFVNNKKNVLHYSIFANYVNVNRYSFSQYFVQRLLVCMKSKYTSILSKFALSYDLKGIFNLSKFFGSLGDIGISVVSIYNRLSNDPLFSLTPPPLQSPLSLSLSYQKIISLDR